MKKSYIAIGLVALALLFAGSSGVHAQATTMPVLYDQNGTAVNNSTTVLGAGYYYLNGSPAQGGHQVYYYGNGTYYDPATQSYGGSVSDPNGTAGVSLNYVAPTVTPGVPNTGAGGMAAYNWAVLIISGLALVASATYIVQRTVSA